MESVLPVSALGVDSNVDLGCSSLSGVAMEEDAHTGLELLFRDGTAEPNALGPALAKEANPPPPPNAGFAAEDED